MIFLQVLLPLTPAPRILVPMLEPHMPEHHILDRSMPARLTAHPHAVFPQASVPQASVLATVAP